MWCTSLSWRPCRPRRRTRIAAPIPTIRRAASIERKNGCGSESADPPAASSGRRAAVAADAKFAVGIPAREPPGARHPIADCVVKGQVVERAAHIPVRRVLIARLVVAARHVIVELRAAPYRPTRRVIEAALCVQRRHAGLREAEIIG